MNSKSCYRKANDSVLYMQEFICTFLDDMDSRNSPACFSAVMMMRERGLEKAYRFRTSVPAVKEHQSEQAYIRRQS